MNVAVDFWEEHCIECGEPDCYASCPNYVPARTGRCGRLSSDSGCGLHEWRTGCRAIAFRPWGKLELLWHGGLAPEWVRSSLLFANGIVEPIARALGPSVYRVWRSVRWRIARAVARRKTAPALWRIACIADNAESLAASIAKPSGEEIYRCVIRLDPGRRFSAEWRLPPVPPESLFRISSAEGTRGIIRFEELSLCEKTTASSGIKVVAWDLDGVLWHGTLSEGEAVRLDDGVMVVVKALDERGIVSSICSKNDEAEALAKLKELGVDEWFVFPQINWGPKSESLKRLATEMNIGLDAIAFVDDREENRREVMRLLPQVSVFAETETATLLSRPEFKAASAEPGALGSARRRMYREEMARRKAAVAFNGDAAAFSAASGLQYELLPVDGQRKTRCRELAQRTNQLNLTARRYDERAFDELVATAECRAVRVWDSYGDYGIVGFVAWRGTHLVECCFSCRVAKKGVERKVLDEISAGRHFTADIVETERNRPIREIVEGWLNG